MADAPSIKANIRAAFRDHQVDGVPASGDYEPLKSDIRVALADQLVDYVAQVGVSAVAGRRVFATTTDRDAWADRPVGAQAYVEATELSYRWAGSAWEVFEDPTLAAAELVVEKAAEVEIAKVAAEAAATENGEALDGHAFRDEATPKMHNGRPILGGATYDADGNAVSFVTQEGQWFPSPDRVGWRLVGQPDLPAPRPGATVGYARAENDVCHIALIIGQSLAYGYGLDGVGVVSGTATYPGLALMPSIGVRMPTVLPGGDNAAPNGRQFTTLVDLIETDDPDVYGCETSASGMVNTLIALHQAEFGYQPRIAALVAARGGSTYAELKRGTVTWAWMLRGLSDMVDAIRAKGWKPRMLPVVWRQTEAEQIVGITAAAYEARLLQLVRDLNADVVAIFGEPVEVQVILEAPQVSSGPVTHPIIEAQANAAARDHRLILGPPYFQHPRPAAWPSLQEIHLMAAGYFRAGVMDGGLTFDHVFGPGYVPPLPEEDYVEVGRQDITLRFPFAVEFDETNVDVKTAGLPNYKGFYFDDYSGSPPEITSHIIHNGNPADPSSSGLYVTLHLEAVPTGSRWRIGYATMPNAVPNPEIDTPGTGPVTGMRGLLRRSRAPILSLGDAHPNYEWVRPFIRTLEA